MSIVTGHPSLRVALALAVMALPACSTSPGGAARAVPSSTATTAAATTAVTAVTVTAPAVTATTAVAPAFAAVVTPVVAADLGGSWHQGCPLAPDQLRLVKLRYWGFDDRPHDGILVLNAEVADAAMSAFRQLYDERFPIRRMEQVDVFGGDDNASMAADNTSGFNCRMAVAAGPPQWSAHAYGTAIDVNPVENPYVQGADVSPPAATAFVDRSSLRPGMAVPGSPLTAAFASIGWSWGGTWSSPDYQHFSAGGG